MVKALIQRMEAPFKEIVGEESADRTGHVSLIDREGQRESKCKEERYLLEGFEDFEEFVLDFEDYDLLESIHTHLGSSPEPSRKLSLKSLRTRILFCAVMFKNGGKIK